HCTIEKSARLQRRTHFRLRIFTALCQSMVPASTLAKARQTAKSTAKSNVLNILTITGLLSSTSLILVGGYPPLFPNSYSAKSNHPSANHRLRSNHNVFFPR